jgi:hypothetical protein
MTNRDMTTHLVCALRRANLYVIADEVKAGRCTRQRATDMANAIMSDYRRCEIFAPADYRQDVRLSAVHAIDAWLKSGKEAQS